MTEVYVERTFQAAICDICQEQLNKRAEREQQPQGARANTPMWLHAMSIGVSRSGNQCRIPRYGLQHAMHLLQTTDACPPEVSEAADPVQVLASLIAARLPTCDTQKIIVAVKQAPPVPAAEQAPGATETAAVAPILTVDVHTPPKEHHRPPHLRASQRTMATLAQMAHLFSHGIAPHCQAAFEIVLRDVAEKLKGKPLPRSPVVLITSPTAGNDGKLTLSVKDAATQAWLQQIMAYHAAAVDGAMPEELYGDLCGLICTEPGEWPSRAVEVAKLFTSCGTESCRSFAELPAYALLDLFCTFRPLMLQHHMEDILFLQTTLKMQAAGTPTSPASTIQDTAAAMARIIASVSGKLQGTEAYAPQLSSLPDQIMATAARTQAKAPPQISKAPLQISKAPLMFGVIVETKVIQSLYMTQAFYADMQARKRAAAPGSPTMQNTLTSLNVYQHAYDSACAQLLSLEAHPETSITINTAPSADTAGEEGQEAIAATAASGSSNPSGKRKASEAHSGDGEHASKRTPHSEADASLAFLADASLLSESRSASVQSEGQATAPRLPQSTPATTTTTTTTVKGAGTAGGLSTTTVPTAGALYTPQQQQQQQQQRQGGTAAVTTQGSVVTLPSAIPFIQGQGGPSAAPSSSESAFSASTITLPTPTPAPNTTTASRVCASAAATTTVGSSGSTGGGGRGGGKNGAQPRTSLSNLDMLQRAGDLVESAEVEESNWTGTELLRVGVSFPVLHGQRMWYVSVHATLQEATAIGYKLSIALNRAEQRTTYLGMWYRDAGFVHGKPTSVDLFFATPSELFDTRFRQLVSSQAQVLNQNTPHTATAAATATAAGTGTKAGATGTSLPRPATAGGGAGGDAGASATSSTTAKASARKAGTAPATTATTTAATVPVPVPVTTRTTTTRTTTTTTKTSSSSSSSSPPPPPSSSRLLSPSAAATLAAGSHLVHVVPDRFTSASIRSVHPLSTAANAVLGKGARYVVTIHCTNRSNTALPVGDPSPATVYPALKAALKTDPVLCDSYFVCRSVAERKFVLLEEEMDAELPWEPVGNGRLHVLNVFLQPRIYASHVKLGVRRSAILYCDVVPRSEVLLQYLSARDLSLKAVLTTPHTLQLEGTEPKVTKALRQFKNNPDALKHLFGQTASLTPAVELRGRTHTIRFPLCIPRFMRPKELFEQLSLILDEPPANISALVINQLPNGDTQRRVLLEGSCKELGSICGRDKAHLFISIGEDVLPGKMSDTDDDDITNPLANTPAPSKASHRADAAAQSELRRRHPSLQALPSSLTVPTLPKATPEGDFRSFPFDDVLLLPDRQFESYLRRVERKFTTDGPDYAAIMRTIRLKYPIQRPPLDEFMKPGKRVRAALVDACNRIGFSEEAADFILLERDRALDAARKARNRQEIRRIAGQLLTELLNLWKAIGQLRKSNGDTSTLQDKTRELRSVVFRITSTQQGITREVARLDKEGLLARAKDYLDTVAQAGHTASSSS